MTTHDDGLFAAMAGRGVSRRDFLKFSSAMALALALPATFAPRIAAAVTAAPRLPLVWLRGLGCGGDGEAFLRSAKPTTAELLLDLLSVDYAAALMAPSGTAAVRSLADAIARGGYIAVVEGAVPTGDGGVACAVGGRAFGDVAREVCARALATIAVGSCAFDGGVAAASGGSTRATGVAGLVPAGRLVSLPGCPVNSENLAATVVHYLTFKQMPITDGRNRPLFAYGGLVHNQCERRAHFEFGEFVVSWGDEAAQKGWCLYKMGCKGPETYASCPTTQYAQGTSWPVRAGHGCISCTMPGFWDAASPFYSRLPSPLPFAPTVSADQVGQLLVGGVAGATTVHGVASYVRVRRTGAAERRAAARRGQESGSLRPEPARLADGLPAVSRAASAGEPPAPVTEAANEASGEPG